MKFIRLIPMLSVMGIIFFLSSQPGDTIDLPDIPEIDKLLHAFVYGILALSVAYAVPGRHLRNSPLRTASVIIFFCLLYGISDEYHQSFVPNRTPSVTDLLADTTGAAMAMFIRPRLQQWLAGIKH